MISPLTLQSHLRALEGPDVTPATITAPPIPGAQPLTTTPSFGDTLAESISKVNQQMLDSDKQSTALATGQSSDVHGTLIAMEKSDIEFSTVLAVRSRVLSAYNAIMSISV